MADALHEEFADLWPGSLPRIEGRLGAIEHGVSAVEGDAITEEVRAAAREGAHMLVGTLGTYGLLDASAVARELEEAFRDRFPEPDDAPRLRERLEALGARVRAVQA